MKYDCALIQDVVSLYHEEVLSERSKEVVNDHLKMCSECREYYNTFSSSDPPVNTALLEMGSLSHLADKIKEYHAYQLGVFLFSIIAMLTIVLPWFGYRGVTETRGTILFSYPAAIIGFALMQFSIWFRFKDYKNRMIWGYIGFGLVLLTEIYVFLTITTGSTIGVDFLLFHFDVPCLDEINLFHSFSNARFGFYLGFLATVWDAIAFSFFVHRFK